MQIFQEALKTVRILEKSLQTKAKNLSARNELEEIYRSSEWYSARCLAGIILNIFEDDVAFFLNTISRANWEELYKGIDAWKVELEQIIGKEYVDVDEKKRLRAIEDLENFMKYYIPYQNRDR